ncbi:MAG: hypothetical protein GWM90_33485 [Gemmatimonadetes bacterium]|nr:ChaN family lipoprotein [Gemmatimonadota bacterium]NIQ60244.1 ChaN family lipoprotein [Gemmatimonadota bacterium]NIU80459.1 hypothetical protein [Gammaproteobacteria bacterium]NIX48790.1 hypothetical protein [Gemmatimonadota bacterium]NIY13246.1 hypothetical protein [Gemmatimonadota bacterium]
MAETGRAARIVLLSDVHGLAGPKRVAAAAIRDLAEGPGLDAVVLEVPSSEQPWIDAYLARREEDASALLARPTAVHEAEGQARAYLEIYREVRRVNAEVGAARRIRVIAADVDDWPPPEGAAPQDVATRYASRAEHMLTRMDEEILSIMPEARLLVFVDGYMALRGGFGELRLAGGASRRVTWLGDLLRQRSGPDARTVLIDAGGTTGTVERLPRYRGTRLHRPLGRELDGPAGTRVTDAFEAVADPVLELSSPGLRLEILPVGYTLDDVADGYIYLEGGR